MSHDERIEELRTEIADLEKQKDNELADAEADFDAKVKDLDVERIMDQIYVIPRLKHLRFYNNFFRLSQNISLVSDSGFEKETEFLRSLLREGTEVDCRVSRALRGKHIELKKVTNIPDVEVKEEGYRILVKPDKVSLEAITDKGM